MTDEDVVAAMERSGGSFVHALAACWRRADPENRQTIQAAFADVWARYTAVAARRWTGQMAGFIPAPTDRSTTTTFDQGGPSEQDTAKEHT
jgi:hypothetical protein